jgi:hypothetical protein
VIREQGLDLGPQGRVSCARLAQEGATRLRRQEARLEQDLLDAAMSKARIFAQGRFPFFWVRVK